MVRCWPLSSLSSQLKIWWGWSQRLLLLMVFSSKSKYLLRVSLLVLLIAALSHVIVYKRVFFSCAQWRGTVYSGVHGHFVVNPITQGHMWHSIVFCRCVYNYGTSLICASLIRIPYIVSGPLSLWFFHDDLEGKFRDWNSASVPC